ncbi:MAG: hypothetical protein KC438_05815, partial [Thermomicrobiales bacterium]|nr:hypothetical protein [Thermomicrobiales bacterium]
MAVDGASEFTERNTGEADTVRAPAGGIVFHRTAVELEAARRTLAVEALDTVETEPKIGTRGVVTAAALSVDARTIAFDQARLANTGVAVLIADLGCVVAAVRHAIGCARPTSAPINTVPGIVTVGAQPDAHIGTGTAGETFCNAILSEPVHTTLRAITGAHEAALAGLRIARFAIAAIVIALAPGQHPASPV